MKYDNIIGGLMSKEDATWECPLCHQTVNARILEMGTKVYYRKVECKCPAALIVSETEKQVEELIKQSSIPTELKNCTFDTFNENSSHLVDGAFVKFQVQEYCHEVKSKQKNFLVLSGKFGAGKTHLAVAANFYLMEQ